MASPPFSITETVPADSEFVRLFPAAERAFRDIVESWFGRISDATSGLPKMVFGTTAALAALNPQPPVGGFRYDTTTHNLSLKTDASTWVVMGTQPGTVAFFFQSTAPLGWTQIDDAEIDEAIIELTIGGSSGGNYEGTTELRAATLAQANLPNVNFAVTGTTGAQSADHTHSGTTASDGLHGHPYNVVGATDDDNDAVGGFMLGNDASTGVVGPHTGTAGDAAGEAIGGSIEHTHTFTSGGVSAGHTHDLTGNAASGGTATAYLSGVKRVRAIVCVKD